MPRRIQRQRRKGWRKPEGAVYVGRGSVWGNPYKVVRQGRVTWHVTFYDRVLATYYSGDGAEAREDAANRFKADYDRDRLPYPTNLIRRELAGHDLMCWCPPRHSCHADILLAIANERPIP